MNWQMNDASKLKRVLIMGSKSSHCVADLLHRGHESEMEAQIIGVLYNHDQLKKLASWYDVDRLSLLASFICQFIWYF
jgi:formyltetrahydrofolate deformylase